MNFIEFNCPDILKQEIDNLANRKDILEIQWKRKQVKLIGTFDAKKIQKVIEKLYQGVYDKEAKREKEMYQAMNKAIKDVKSNYLKSKKNK